MKLGESKHSGSSLYLCALLSLNVPREGPPTFPFDRRRSSLSPYLLSSRYPRPKESAMSNARDLHACSIDARVFVYDNIYILHELL